MSDSTHNPPRRAIHVPSNFAGVARPEALASHYTGHISKAKGERSRQRVALTGALFLACFIVLSGRLFNLALEGNTGTADGPPALRSDVVRPEIVDRNGRILATNLMTASLYADARKIIDPAEAASQLISVFPDLDSKTLEGKLTSDRAFVWLKRDLTPGQHQAAHSLGVPGLYFHKGWKRVYPKGRIAPHVLGHVDVDSRGLAGIERYLDLNATDGSDGGPTRLSIDLRVQHAMRDELEKGMATFGAKGAVGVVLDVRSGEVMALSSLPDYDPNDFSAASANARFNRATVGVYEMGSIFKTFTTAMALDSGVVSLKDGYDATDPIKVAQYTIKDFHPERRWLSVPEIFLHSSNIGSAKMALDVGVDAHRDFLQSLNLLDRIETELPESGTPLVPRPWRPVNTMTIAFGHGLAAAPLQTASAVAAIVNGGRLINPTFLRRESGANVESVRVISPETSETMRALLRLVVTDGTGRRADVPGYPVGGKTGTAEKPTAKGYDANALITSFVATFPAHNPRYLLLVMLDEPKGLPETYGFATAGWNAGPVAGRIVRRVAPLLGLDPVDPKRGEPQPLLVAY